MERFLRGTAMRGADLALVLTALVVLGLTAGALAAMQARDDRVRFEFTESPVALGESSGPTDAAGILLNWTLPDNATAANLTVLVGFSGQAFTGGSAAVQAQVLGPDGSRGPFYRTSMAIAPGATTGEASFSLELRWDEAPDGKRADPDGFDASVRWEEPLQLRVVVQPPSDVPTAEYSFTARATAEVLAFAAVEASDST